MKRLRFARPAVLACVIVAALASTGAAHAALGGPVIIGGDDLTDHGSVNSAGDLQNGWLYLQRALENVSPKVVRPGADMSVAALGSTASTATSGNAGAAIGRAAAKAGLTVTYYDGAAAINGFFSALNASPPTTSPRIIWIAGTGASNDLDSSEAAALTANATSIADFVNSGGGLVSHGVEYGWLFALLPGLTTVNSGSSNDLYLTPEGIAAFPGVTNANVNAGPWHNYFQGDAGGLQVLVRSRNRNDSTGADAAVILGGASVTLPGAIVLTPGTATNPSGTSHTVTATVRDTTGAVLPGVTVTFSVASGPNAGVGGAAVTNASGQASFSYTSNGAPGTDLIQASFVDATQTTRSDVATKIWLGSAVVVPRSIPPADIGVTKTDSPDPASVGENLTYTMEVTNFGPGDAPGATFGDTLPSGVTFVSVTTTKGSCTGGPRVTCTLGTVAVGEVVTIVIVVRVEAAGTLSNTAEVGTTVADHNVANNNTATAVTAAQGAFTPPAAPPPAAAGCTLATTTRSVPAGVASTISVSAEQNDGTPRNGVRITVRGAGMKAQTKLSRRGGIATFRVIPKRGGARIVVRGAACGRALAVAAVRSATCTGLSVTPKAATVGAPLRVSVRLRIAGRPAIGVVVRIRGVGLSATARTNSAGLARLSGMATQPGIATVTVPGILTCSKRIGVSGAFGPPRVTG